MIIILGINDYKIPRLRYFKWREGLTRPFEIIGVVSRPLYDNVVNGSEQVRAITTETCVKRKS